MPWVLAPEKGMVCRSPSLLLPARSPIHNNCYDQLGQAGEDESPLDRAETRYGERRSR